MINIIEYIKTLFELLLLPFDNKKKGIGIVLYLLTFDFLLFLFFDAHFSHIVAQMVWHLGIDIIF